MPRKNLVILGSSGSIGESALEVVRQHRDRLRVVGLSVNENIGRLAEQIREFRPSHVAVGDAEKARALKRQGLSGVRVMAGRDGICALAALKEADTVLVGIVGSEALFPLLAAIGAAKTIALANKEAVVIAGPLVRRALKRSGGTLIPVDSEQNAIFQCLQGHGRAMVQKVYLTASGGALLHHDARRLRNVSLKEVLAHPRWKMGRKITVDSATLMNKGLEVLETEQLFELDLEKIEVLIHPQSLIHSMVEFVDGSILAQMAVTDMKLPIQVALSFPERWPNPRLRMDPLRIPPLTFSRPDQKRFPCLGLAFAAARQAGLAPCALNAANEVAVTAFLRGRLLFRHIAAVIEKVMEKTVSARTAVTLQTVFETDRRAREAARRWTAFYARKV